MTGPWGTASRIMPWLSVVTLTLALSVVVSGPALAQEPGEHGQAEGHAGESPEGHHHRNHLSFFIGSTEAEEHHGEQEDPDFTIGLDYERRLSKVFGIGVLVDFVVEGKREYMIGVPVFLHAGERAKFQVAPGFHHLSHTGENELVLRTGFMWEFPVGGIALSPTFFYDIVDGQNFIVLGVTVGKGF